MIEFRELGFVIRVKSEGSVENIKVGVEEIFIYFKGSEENEFLGRCMGEKFINGSRG